MLADLKVASRTPVLKCKLPSKMVAEQPKLPGAANCSLCPDKPRTSRTEGWAFAVTLAANPRPIAKRLLTLFLQKPILCKYLTNRDGLVIVKECMSLVGPLGFSL